MFKSLRRAFRRKKKKSKPAVVQDLRPASETLELISVHIPKTAGVAFWRVLTHAYAQERVFQDYEDKPLHPQKLFQQDFEAWKEQNRQGMHKVPPGTRVVHGHFWGGKYDALFPNARKITWLRDPVRRVISHYFYWKTQPPIDDTVLWHYMDKNVTLLQFAEIPKMQNVVADTFLRECDLSTFDFVGIHEFFDEDLRQLSEMLDWPTIEAPVANKGTYGTAETVDEETRRKIRELNQRDMQLYQAALHLREKRLAGLSARDTKTPRRGETETVRAM